jgi:hypothetical protein
MAFPNVSAELDSHGLDAGDRLALAVIGIWLANYLLMPSSAKAHIAPQSALVPALDQAAIAVPRDGKFCPSG